MTSQSTPLRALPAPDVNADRPVPPVDTRPAWVLPCGDLDSSVEQFTSAGFALLAIGPADDPRWALMGHGHGRYITTLRLDTNSYAAGRRQPFLEVDDGDPLLHSAGESTAEFVAAGLGAVSSSVAVETDPPIPSLPAAGASPDWVVGRAGMRYRDLLPDRWGGQFIASHIHIPKGGPVPDYVHYHHVDFQLIFCHRGWVRVVYQDQGEPFVLDPGDAILQAPGIRHQVLEASDDLHVIEVSSPAEHATFVEHDLDLPNGVDVGHSYGGQQFVHHRAAGSPWLPNAEGIRRQSLDLEPATSGRYSASVIEMEGSGDSSMQLPLVRPADFEFLTVLDGTLTVADSVGGDSVTCQTGAALGLDDSGSWSARTTEPTRLLAVSRHRRTDRS